MNIGKIYLRGVVPRVAGAAMAPPDFGRSVNPISTRGTDYAHLITTGTTGFSELPTALDYREEQNYSRETVITNERQMRRSSFPVPSTSKAGTNDPFSVHLI